MQTSSHVRSPLFTFTAALIRSLCITFRCSRSSLALAALILLAALAASRPASAQVVSWWPGEGNFYDVVSGNDGTPHGNVTFVPGTIGQAFGFDGVDSGINVPDADNLKITGSLTISAWINVASIPDSSQLWGMILFRGDDQPGLDPYFLGVLYNGNIIFHIESLSGIDEVWAPVPVGQFVRVIAILDDATGHMRLYLNGTLAAQTITAVRPFADLDPNSNPSIGIGNHGGWPYTPHNFPFHGTIDELMIANQALLVPVSLGLTPSTVAGCKNVTGKVVLSDPAPFGGAIVGLSNTNPAASLPASVTVPAGKISKTFTITTTPVTATQTGVVTATYSTVRVSAVLKVRPIGVKLVSLIPNPVTGGNGVTGQVTLECPAAPGDIVVTLSSTNPSVANPAVMSITIPAGSSAGTFMVNTTHASVTKYATIKATANGITKSKRLQVDP